MRLIFVLVVLKWGFVCVYVCLSLWEGKSGVSRGWKSDNNKPQQCIHIYIYIYSCIYIYVYIVVSNRQREKEAD